MVCGLYISVFKFIYLAIPYFYLYSFTLFIASSIIYNILMAFKFLSIHKSTINIFLNLSFPHI